VAALLCSLGFASFPASSAGASLSFIPCANAAGFSCSSLPVPLVRSSSASGAITLGVERKLAGAIPSRSAVVALAGGPGQAAIPLGPFIAQAIAPALASRDLLLFDQRGTGESNPLSCVALGAPEGSLAGNRFTDCANELGAARGGYTTEESVEDIEALRQAAGYEKLVLYGTSYGTRVALDYAQRYPQNVEALVLDSTETPRGPDPFRLSTFRAIKPALGELCSGGACSGVSGNPLADLARLIARINASPLSGYVYEERGKRVKLTLRSEELYGLLLAGDLNPALRADIPAAVHAAVNRDSGPLLRLLALQFESSTEGESSEVDSALFFATTCEDTVFPWQRAATVPTRTVELEAALSAMPASDFYPFDSKAGVLDGVIPVCLQWPNASPPPPAESPLPNVPTLILSGGQDLRTPTENALDVAGMIPDAQVLTVPYTGHSVIGSDLSGCAAVAVRQFFTGVAVAPCQPTVNRLPPVPVAPLSLSHLSATGNVTGPGGRALTATLDTVRDLRRTIIEIGLTVNALPVGVRFGGLRGGSATLTKAGAVLNHLSYVPGVQLSGTISTNLLLKGRGASSTIRLSGSAGASGALQLASGGKLKGDLDGVRFSVKVSRTAIAAGAQETRQRAAEAEWPNGIDPFPLSGLARLR
jgi:pimeloyl-ACP methyl ester carboxylesterase